MIDNQDHRTRPRRYHSLSFVINNGKDVNTRRQVYCNVIDTSATCERPTRLPHIQIRVTVFQCSRCSLPPRSVTRARTVFYSESDAFHHRHQVHGTHANPHTWHQHGPRFTQTARPGPRKMAPIKGRKSANKNLPILSHEFVIQNHADIVSCVAMVIVIGLMVQVSVWPRPRDVLRLANSCLLPFSVDLASVVVIRSPPIRPSHRTQCFANIWYRSEGFVRHLLLFPHMHHISCHHSRIHFRCK